MSTSRTWNARWPPHARGGFQLKAVKDFRDILADKSIDAVCISTPDHWHAYMTVEACKAGKDVYVEKPACVYVEEGQKMVQAARKYNRVVQAGTMQRSGGYFLEGRGTRQERRPRRRHVLPCLPERTDARKGFGNPPDSDPPADLDWDMWLGPAPEVPFNREPLGREDGHLPDLSLFLGLRGRRHDRLGCAPDRSAAPVLRRSDADRDLRAWAASSTSQDNTQTPDTMLATFYYESS